MLELLLCSLLTIFPDYLYRRYRQGKRIGQEITLYSVWFELRWGIIACLMLTIGLITTIFYFHPTSNNVTSYFRTVPIVPEAGGRVAEIFIRPMNDHVDKGAPIFRLDSSTQDAAVETARRRVAEVDAKIVAVQADLLDAEGKIEQAVGALHLATDELATKQDLNERNANVVSRRELERLQAVVDTRQGALHSANAGKSAVELNISTLLPAQRASAEAALTQAQAELAKMTVRAGVSGRVEQFSLQLGDVVNPFARPAGLLIPDGSGTTKLAAGFGQIEGQVLKVGMIAEAACVSKPWTIIPMVVTDVQDAIAAGQIRGGDQLIDPSQSTDQGTIVAWLEPLYAGGLDGVIPGSSCTANAYTNNHERLASGDLDLPTRLALHMVDTVGAVHALLLRIHSLLLPIQTLVFSGGH
jgi:multidrug resistance efflux pump